MTDNENFQPADEEMQAALRAQFQAIARVAADNQHIPGSALTLAGLYISVQLEATNQGAEAAAQTLRELADALETEGRVLTLQTPIQH